MSKSGFIQDTLDIRDVWEDELAGEAIPVALPPKYRTEDLVFEPQGSWPFCASFCVTKMTEYAIKKLRGDEYELSQPQLFFQSGGGPNGSSFRSNLDTVKNRGAVPFSKLPMPKDLWDTSEFNVVKNMALAIPPDPTIRILGYVRVNPNREAIKEAIFKHGMVMVGVAASGGYWAYKATRPVGKPDDHATLLIGWEADGTWVAFDSLQPSKGFDW